MGDLAGRVALITGGSSGIGKASAIRMAQAGARVAILGHTEDEVHKAVRHIEEKSGGEALPLVADVASDDQMQQAMTRLIQTWGRLDIVFANAGINGVWAPLEEISTEDWDQTLEVNLKGTFLTVKHALPHLKQQQTGAIVVTSSVNGTRMFSNTGATAYACSKAAQVAFVKMMALELAEHRIRINVICPGAIDTDIEDNTERVNLDEIREPVEFPEGQIPLTDGKPGSSDQVADLVMFLVTDASSHITGTEVWIDGAQSLLRG